MVPFQQGFVEVTDFEKRVYYVTLLLTAAAGICLMAPVARHRLRFRDQDKRWIVASSHKYAIAGMGLLALAISGVILLISHYVYDARHGRDRDRGRRRWRSAGSGSAPRWCASSATTTERPGLGGRRRRAPACRSTGSASCSGRDRGHLLGPALLPDHEGDRERR